MISMTWPQYTRRECTVIRPVKVRLYPKEAEVLSVLLIRHPEPVTTAELVDALWPDPDNEPGWAEAVLGQHISRLRQKIGSERIAHDWRGYRLMQEAA